jgi:hypothetical protein
MATGALSLLLALGLPTQAHTQAVQPQNGDTVTATAMMTMQERMQGMQQMMQGMQEMMQGMQERMDGMHQMMQDMHGGQSMMQGMQNMSAPQDTPAHTCLSSSSQAGLSTLLLGSVQDLGLTESQATQLQSILSRAQSEALEALTPVQRDRLASSPPPASALCQQEHSTHEGTGHH